MGLRISAGSNWVEAVLWDLCTVYQTRNNISQMVKDKVIKMRRNIFLWFSCSNSFRVHIYKVAISRVWWQSAVWALKCHRASSYFPLNNFIGFRRLRRRKENHLVVFLFWRSRLSTCLWPSLVLLIVRQDLAVVLWMKLLMLQKGSWSWGVGVFKV